MFREPGGSQAGHLVEGSGFLEQVGGSGDNLELDFSSHLVHGRLIQPEDLLVSPAHDEERWRPNLGKGLGGEIRSSSPGHHGPCQFGPTGRRDQGRRRTRTRPEETDGQP